MALIGGCQTDRGSRQVRPTTLPAAVPATPSVDRGRYLVQVGGCNDCHTPRFRLPGANVPESDWLTGVPVGWRGPWGTSYAANLRLTVQTMDEDNWVLQMRSRNVMPPMPWDSLHAMTDADLRGVYRYIHALGPKGERMPAYVPPGVEPPTPYLDLTPKDPAKK
jgi:mono/diheme cytochrome c family protein